MLRRNGRNMRKTLKALTDPQPEFVSLVFGGANKTPFRALRADGATIVETQMTEEAAIKAETHAIARVEFTADKFVDEAAVKTWLADGGYDDKLAIQKTDTGFMVDATADLPADVATTVIDLVDLKGLKITAVAIKADDSVLELTEKAMNPGALALGIKALRGCYDECAPCLPSMSAWGVGDSVADVLDNNFDGVPPGMLDMVMALYDAIRNNLADDDVAGARACIDEFTSLFDKLMAMFPDVDDAGDGMVAKDDMAAGDVPAPNPGKLKKGKRKELFAVLAPEIEMSKEAETEVVAKTDDATVAVVTEVTDVVAEKTEDVVAEVTEVAVVDGEAVVAAVTEVVVEAPVDAELAVAEKIEDSDVVAVAEVTEAAPDAIAQLTAAVGALTTMVESMKSNLTGEIGQVVERVAAIEDVRQTRKGADVDETSTANSKTTASDGIADMRTRSVLGMRRLPS